MADTVKVACSVPNGVELRLGFPSYGEARDPNQTPRKVVLGGPNSARQSGANGMSPAGIGITDVDAAFFTEWLEANRLNPLVTSGAIKEFKEFKEDVDQPTAQPEAEALAEEDTQQPDEDQ